MRSITPNIYLDNCKEALEFYKEAFGGRIDNVQLADDYDGFEGQEGKIIHAELHINDQCVLYFVDLLGKDLGGNIELVLELDDEDEIRKVYDFLNKDGNVDYELQKAPWGALHALLTDKYGVTWGLNFALPTTGF